MRSITCEIRGVPTDVPTLVVDLGHGSFPATLSAGMATFTLPSSVPAPFGGWIHYGGLQARVYIPPDGWHGPATAPPFGVTSQATTVDPPILSYPVLGVRVSGPNFVGPDGARWYWKGMTDFRLAQRHMAGENIRSLLAERRTVGANLVRVLAMKANNTGWALVPQQQGDIYWQRVKDFWHLLADAGLCCEWTVFADTAVVMPAQAEQLAFWQRTIETAIGSPHVLIELCNEWNHPTQQLNPQAFAAPTTGTLASHGSGQTDADSVQPRWHFAGYHARRDGARGFTNYDRYEFQAEYPASCPLIPDEGAKPENYNYDVAYATLLGRHAACGAGGTFHWSGGVDSRSLTSAEASCASAFFAAIV